MLLDAFGLQADPFMDTADPAFYYETLACAHWRRRLFECLSAGRGLAVVVGPVGAGKTTLFNAVLQDMLQADRFRVGLVLDPGFSSESEWLTAVSQALAFDAPAECSLREQKDALKRQLFAAAAGGGLQPVLFIDEAQILNEALFESVRLLLNYQLDDRKLLSLAFSGQPELAGTLARHPSLRDRVALWLELQPLTLSEASELINYRLRRAGYAGVSSPFQDAALEQIWRNAGGLPRRLTALAREALESAAERRSRAVSIDDVAQAVRRLPPDFTPPRAAERELRAPSEPSARTPWWKRGRRLPV